MYKRQILCHKIKPYVQSGRVFKKDESLTMWISADNNRIPMKIKADLIVGSIRIDLEAFSNLNHPFEIKFDKMKRLIKLLFLASILTAIIFSIYYLINWVNDKNFDVEITIKEKENIEFGFNLDNFKVKRDTIRFGDSFGEIMLRNKLSYSQIYNIVQSIKDSFDVRWLTTGKPYTILSSKDSLANPEYFIYQPNRLNYVVIDFSNLDSISAYNKKNHLKL